MRRTWLWYPLSYSVFVHTSNVAAGLLVWFCGRSPHWPSSRTRACPMNRSCASSWRGGSWTNLTTAPTCCKYPHTIQTISWPVVSDWSALISTSWILLPHRWNTKLTSTFWNQLIQVYSILFYCGSDFLEAGHVARLFLPDLSFRTVLTIMYVALMVC